MACKCYHHTQQWLISSCNLLHLHQILQAVLRKIETVTCSLLQQGYDIPRANDMQQ
jgi:hypothetical protein